MHCFRAMNTDVTVLSDSPSMTSVAARITGVFEAAERRCSRFRPDSELMRLNEAHGPVVVSPELFECLERARVHCEATDGLFDPAVGGALLAHGYDRSFGAGMLDRDAPVHPARGGRFLEVELVRATRTVTRPAHIVLDLGGMVKGATVDAALAHVGDAGAVDAGGDARVHGPGLDGASWLVDVEDPADPSRTVATLALDDQAVATSASNRRAWRLGAGRAHHLIDPRTQAPAVTDLLQVTVVAPTTELAEVLAKAAFVAGRRGARALLSRHPRVGGVLVCANGTVVIVGDVDVREVRRG